LLKASVGAPNGGERILAILGPGSVVGELTIIDGAPRSASVTAPTWRYYGCFRMYCERTVHALSTPARDTSRTLTA
jgi:hypothetical protein